MIILRLRPAAGPLDDVWLLRGLDVTSMCKEKWFRILVVWLYCFSILELTCGAFWITLGAFGHTVDAF